PVRVEETAPVLGLRIGPQEDYDSVLRQAHLRLAEDHRSSQELTWQLSKALKERNRLAAELDREMSVAREIQRSLLPAKPAASFPVSAFNLSARHLSGDFYDFFTLADGRIYFVLGDVAGKGTTAALLMAKVISLFRCLGKRVAAPGSLLAQLNNEICETTIRGMFITLAGGLYDPASGEVILVNGGHPPPLLLHRNGKYRALEAEVPPLGIVAGQRFPETRLNLGESSLYLYSDGAIECRCAQSPPLGLGGLVRHLRHIHAQPPGERLDAIGALFSQSSLPLRDDVTVLLLEKRDG
ncbi:MAG: serine/threonine-protein phosphatase, partial [Desulfobulbaceae bacterium]|nr:serine/threonine-protein phosphatase [Desulfobulbaceae bacterium]